MKAATLCSTKFCRKPRAKKRTVCFSCRQRRYKELNPVSYYFNAKRGNAKRMGKIFTLTLEQFTGFLKDSGYLETKGNTLDSMQIDCRENHLGYTLNNIRLVPMSVNLYKQNYVDYKRHGKKLIPRHDNSEVPF